MRIMNVDCEVEYEGRGSTVRGRGQRLLIFKDDGSFLVHSSTGVKPINYMTKVVSTTINDDSVIVRSKTETITVTIHGIISDTTFEMTPDTAKTTANGTERQLQEWLSRDDNWSSVFGEDSRFLLREMVTDNGSVDLTGIRDDGALIIIEVKRHAGKNDVFQVLRYKDAIINSGVPVLNERIGKTNGSSFEFPVNKPVNIECWLVASTAHASASESCAAHGVRFDTVGEDWLDETIDARKASKTAVNPKKRKTGASNPTLLDAIPVENTDSKDID